MLNHDAYSSTVISNIYKSQISQITPYSCLMSVSIHVSGQLFFHTSPWNVGPHMGDSWSLVRSSHRFWVLSPGHCGARKEILLRDPMDVSLGKMSSFYLKNAWKNGISWNIPMYLIFFAIGSCVCTWDILLYMYVCMYYVCIYVYMFINICIYVYKYMYIYMYMYICIYVYMYICIYVYMHICIHVYMYICIYVYMYICKYVNMYICIYVNM